MKKISDTITLHELCEMLSISTATGRNWLKLGKLTPCYMEGKKAYFTKEYANTLIEELMTGDNKALKSRRNKSYISGNALYNAYISDESPNVSAVQRQLGAVKDYGLSLTDQMIRLIIADCAMKLLSGRFDGKNADMGIYERLAADLTEDMDKQTVIELRESYPRIFETVYTYENGEDLLGLLYISCRNMSSRKASGSYYTPMRIAGSLVDNLEKTEDRSVLDPCCGTGSFLMCLPEDFPVENIYGNDIDSLAVSITRINMALKYKVRDIDILYKNITCSDFLTAENTQKYDCIIGNPPWGYEFSAEECGKLREKYNVAVGKNIESYDVFVENALNHTKTGGVVSFVLPEAILNVKSHKPVRQLICDKCNIERLSYLGEVFKGVHCPSIILQLRYTEKVLSTAGMKVDTADKEFVIKTERTVNADTFSLRTTDEEYSIIQRIKHLENAEYLKGKAVFALGIVTGDNDTFITHEKNEHNEPVLKGTDIKKYGVKAIDNYIEYKPESFQQVAPDKYYRAPEKLLYRFIGGRLVFAYDDRQTLSLNSCNILIPDIEGLHIKYVLAVLNSSVAQFFYEKEFGSVKLLRSHIEQIPIPVVGVDKQSEIITLVDSLSECSSYTEDVEATKDYRKLDEIISGLYGLNDFFDFMKK